MKKKRLLDTNVIVRHLVRDSPALARRAQNLFEASDRGEVSLVILPQVLAECVFVLESFYDQERTEIATALEVLITSPGIEVANKAVCLDAFKRYVSRRAHFVDCTLASLAVAEQLSVATFDSDFRGFSDVEVEVD